MSYGNFLTQMAMSGYPGHNTSPRVVAMTNGIVTFTGNTNPNQIVTSLTIPGGTFVKPGSRLRIFVQTSFNAGAEFCVAGAYLGGISGAEVMPLGLGLNNIFCRSEVDVVCVGPQSQRTIPSGAYPYTGGTLLTSTIDMTQDQPLVFAVQMYGATDVLTIESFSAELISM
jgi:hypothetical protein